MTHLVAEDHGTENPLSSLLYLVGGLLALLLGLRFVFLLFGINNVPIANFIYNTTSIFVQPFYGLFGRTYLSGTPQIELESLIALFIIWLIVSLVAGVFRRF